MIQGESNERNNAHAKLGLPNAIVHGRSDPHDFRLLRPDPEETDSPSSGSNNQDDILEWNCWFVGQ